MLPRLLVLPVGQRLLPGAVAGVFAPNAAPPDYIETSGLPPVLRPQQYKANAQDVVALKPHVAALCQRYGEIRAPTAIVTGDSDGVVYASIHSAGCARDISGAVLTTLKGVGHTPHYSAPDAVIAAVVDVAERAESERADRIDVKRAVPAAPARD